MSDKRNLVYLHDWSILPWERPVGEKEISTLRWYNGSTTLVRFLGLETLNLHVGENPRRPDDPRGLAKSYQLIGSVAKYLADIGRLSEWRELADRDTTRPEIKREILFDGNVAIYKPGIIPGTKISGYNLVQEGRIWSATTNVLMAEKPKALVNLVLGEFKGPEDALRRVEAIIAGYKDQEENRKRAQLEAKNDAFVRGGEAGSRSCF